MPELSRSVPDLPPRLAHRAALYLAAHLELLRVRQDATWAALATHMEAVPAADGSNPSDIATLRAANRLKRWVNRHPEVDAWVERQFEQLGPSKWRIAHQFGRAALRGSVPHADWLAKVFGWYQQGESGGPGVVNFNGPTIATLIPRAEWPGRVEK